MSTSETLQAELQFSLDTCAKEPIRIPGMIQPHGALIVVEPDTLKLLQASANASAMLGGDLQPGHIVPAIYNDVVGDEIKRWISSTERLLMRTVRLNERRMQLLAHRSRQGVIIEFEPAPASQADTLEALYPRVGRFTDDVQDVTDIEAICALAAREFRAISEFNRVLIYRFDADWHGEVLAEDNDGVLPSYYGLHFPASDIPAQARELYRMNRLRLIKDANATPVPVLPTLNPIDRQPLDMSFAALRSVSPIHLEYMRNMGTLASMSVSLVVDGKLWGLVSCHNATPQFVNAQARTACDLLGRMLSQQIGTRDRNVYAARRLELKRHESALLAHLANASTLHEGLKQHQDLWLDVAESAGVALIHDDTVTTAGECPPPERIRTLVEKLQANSQELFSTDSLTRQWPEFGDIAEVASGVLAVSISQLHASYVLWFRPEVLKNVRWAGEPQKNIDSSGVLHPRHSFASWQQLVQHHSRPWSEAVIDAAADFRHAVINLVLRRAEERAELTGKLQRSNRELESFSYSVSHDLRAPFRHIVGYVQLLRDSETNLSSKSQHYLDGIKESAATAGQLVDDLLSFSHLGRAELNFAPVDMNKLLQEVLRTLRPDIETREIEWQIGSLPPSSGDAVLLRQAWINLVANAVKYTRTRSPAVIRISGDSTATHRVYSIADNGVGFDMTYVHKLFGVFQRLHRIEDFEGTGIGLALTKRVVERHGGWISAQGVIDGGATFTFGLPIKNGERRHA